MFLDELVDELREVRGLEVDQSTVWRALHRSGFAMKKVCSTSLVEHSLMSLSGRLHVSRWSGVQQSVLNTSQTLASTFLRSSLCLLMGALVITTLHIEVKHGHFRAQELYRKHFLYVVKGQFTLYCICRYLLVKLQIFCPSGTFAGWNHIMQNSRGFFQYGTLQKFC